MSRINTIALNRFRYGFYAPVYDWLAKPLAAGRRRSFELLDVQPGESVLIDGAGTGLDIPYVTHAASIAAVDLTPGMIRRAEARARRLGVDIDCRVMNAHELAFPDDSFDVVVLHLVLAVLPDPVACIKEAARVMKPTGRVSIFDKFLPDGRSPSLARRAAGAFTDLFFSDINRELGPLLAAADLTLTQSNPSTIGGLYTVNIVRKAT